MNLHILSKTDETPQPDPRHQSVAAAVRAKFAPDRESFAYQTGKLTVQITELSDALARYAQHRNYCSAGSDATARCCCGLSDALRIGADTIDAFRKGR